jgi:hypothetical protein
MNNVLAVLLRMTVFTVISIVVGLVLLRLAVNVLAALLEPVTFLSANGGTPAEMTEEPRDALGDDGYAKTASISARVGTGSRTRAVNP